MDTRAAVVAATQDELIENGHDALSVEAVAQRAGVPADAVRDAWPDAEALVALVFEELGEHELVLLNTGSLETDLRALAAGIAAFHGVPRLRETFQALVYSAGRSPRAAESLYYRMNVTLEPLDDALAERAAAAALAAARAGVLTSAR